METPAGGNEVPRRRFVKNMAGVVAAGAFPAGMAAGEAASGLNTAHTSAPEVAGPDVKMKITKVETFIVGNPWKNWVFVKVDTDEGLVGWGEATGGLESKPPRPRCTSSSAS